MITPDLRARAETLGHALPPLLAEAQHLASVLILGAHGRRRAGQGDGFWQYRTATHGDSLRQIDWRRSARGDTPYLRESEWQAAQSVMLWVDPGQSLDFASREGLPTKAQRARLLALALAVALLRGEERVGLFAPLIPARAGRRQIEPLAEALGQPRPDGDHAAPPLEGMVPHGHAVLISDFLGDLAALEASLARAAALGKRGVLLQILDPAEAEFPFAGRVRFRSVSGGHSHETLSADALRDSYLARLAERQAMLQEFAHQAGWHFHSHSTDASAQGALLWLYRAIERGR